MRTLLALGLAVAILGTLRADDNDSIAGQWTIASVVRDGKDETGNYKNGLRLHDGNKYIVAPPAGSSQSEVGGTFTTDSTKKPATIDMKPKSGRYKDKALLGIYKVDGETLTIAFAEPGKDRPTAFASKAGSGIVVAIHKKVK